MRLTHSSAGPGDRREPRTAAAPRFLSLLGSRVSGRSIADLLLFGVTGVELGILFLLVPRLTLIDWIYVLQHLLVLGIALVRSTPAAQDRSAASAFAVCGSYIYPYALVIYFRWGAGHELWPEVGFILVVISAVMSLAGLLSINRFFGLRPALRGLATQGPYGLVRHPLYLSYIIGDVGYALQGWKIGTMLIVLAGWVTLLYRIHAEERVLAAHPEWPRYVATVRYRLFPGFW